MSEISNGEIASPNAERSAEQSLARSIEAGKTTVSSLTEFAIAHGVDQARLGFANDIFDEQAFFVVPDRMFNQAYQDIRGLTDEQANNIGAITDRSHGTIFMRESTTLKTHYVIHEGMHRARFLARQANSVPSLEAQLAGDYFLNVGQNGKLEVSEELKDLFPGESVPDFAGFVGQLARDADEGIAEWAARTGEELSAAYGSPLPVETSDHAYPQHVEVVEGIQAKIVESLNCEPERATAILIDIALTGDLIQLRQILGEDFRSAMEQFFDHPRNNGAVHIDS